MTQYLSSLALAFALTGCAGSSQFMTEVPPGTPTVAPMPNVATIVFIRESGFGFAVNFAILDQASNFLGEAVAKSHFAIQVPPGEYFFIARGGEGTDVVRANVSAGNEYFIHVTPRMGTWLAGVELDPIKPREPEWSLLPDWLSNSHRLVPLASPPQYSGAPAPSANSASWLSQMWERVPDKAAHTVEPDDGTATPLPMPGPAMAPSPRQSRLAPIVAAF